MAQRIVTRRSGTEGSRFGWFMVAVLVFLVVLMVYFQGHQGASPVPSKPPGILRAA